VRLAVDEEKIVDFAESVAECAAEQNGDGQDEEPQTAIARQVSGRSVKTAGPAESVRSAFQT